MSIYQYFIVFLYVFSIRNVNVETYRLIIIAIEEISSHYLTITH